MNIIGAVYKIELTREELELTRRTLTRYIHSTAANLIPVDELERIKDLTQQMERIK
jgi:hypothetical protein